MTSKQAQSPSSSLPHTTTSSSTSPSSSIPRPSILSRLDQFLTSLSLETTEQHGLEQAILSYTDNFCLSSSSPESTALFNKFQAKGKDSQHISAYNVSLLTALEHATSSMNTDQLLDIVKTAKTTKSSTTDPSTLQSDESSLFPQFCSLYDRLNPHSSLTRVITTPSAGKNDTMQYIRSNPTMATATQLNANIVWHLTATRIIGIDIGSLIESQYTGYFRATAIHPQSLQNGKFDLACYNSLVVNQTSTLAAVWSTNIPTVNQLIDDFHNEAFTLNNNTNIKESDFFHYPIPFTVELPQLDVISIDTLEQWITYQSTTFLTTQSISNVPNECKNLSIFTPLATRATFLLNEQIGIISALYNKYDKAGVDSTGKDNLSSIVLSNLAQFYTKNCLIQDIQFHGLSPTTLIVLTTNTISMYTLLTSFFNTHAIPLRFLPTKMYHCEQQSATPTLFYDLNLLPFVFSDTSLVGEYDLSNPSIPSSGYNTNNKNGEHKSAQNSTLNQEWIKLMYIPLPNHKSSSKSQKSTNTINGTSPSCKTTLSSTPPISFTYLLLSKTGTIAVLSPLIPHMFYCSIDLLLEYRAWIVSNAFPDLISQLCRQFAQLTPESPSNCAFSLTQHTSTLQPLKSTRWVALLNFFDQIFGISPKSPFTSPMDQIILSHLQINPISTLTDVEFLTLCTIDPPASQHMVADTLFSDCLIQSPILQILGKAQTKYYQHLPSQQANQTTYNEIAHAEQFIDFTLISTETPIIASISSLNNNKYRLPSFPSTSSPEFAGQTTDDANAPSSYLRHNIHYTLLNTSLHSQYTQKTHLFTPFVYAPIQYFQTIENNYHKYVLRVRNSILATKKRDVPLGNLENRESFTHRLTRLSTPILSMTQAVNVSFPSPVGVNIVEPGNDSKMDKYLFDFTRKFVPTPSNNTTNNVHTNNNMTSSNQLSNNIIQYTSPYIANRELSFNMKHLKLSNASFAATNFSIFPILNTTGYLRDYNSYHQIASMGYIDSSLIYVHLPELFYRLKPIQHYVQQSLFTAVQHNATMCASSSTSNGALGAQNNSLTQQKQQQQQPQHQRPALNFDFTINDSDNNKQQQLQSQQYGAIDNGPMHSFSSYKPVTKSFDVSTIDASVCPSRDQFSALSLSLSTAEILNEALVQLVVNLRQKQLQNATTSIKLHPITHHLYPQITQSCLPGLQIVNKFNPEEFNVNEDQDDSQAAICGIKHVSLAVSTTLTTHSMAYYLSPKLLAITFQRIHQKFPGKIQLYDPTTFKLFITTLYFFLHGLTNTTIMSNTLTYNNTIDNAKLTAIQNILTCNSTQLSTLPHHHQKTSLSVPQQIKDVIAESTSASSTSSVKGTSSTSSANNITFVDNLTTLSPLTSRYHSYPPSQNDLSHTHFPTSPLHLPLSLLYAYWSFTTMPTTTLICTAEMKKKITATLTSHLLSNSLQQSTLPITIELSAMYLNLLDQNFDPGSSANHHNQSFIEPFNLDYASPSKFYPLSQQNGTNQQHYQPMTSIHNPSTATTIYSPSTGQFKPTKQFSLFLLRQLSSETNDYNAAFQSYAVPLAEPIHSMCDNLLSAPSTSGTNKIPNATVRSILTDPSTLELQQKYPEYNHNAELDAAIDLLKDEYSDIIESFEECTRTYVLSNTLNSSAPGGSHNTTLTSISTAELRKQERPALTTPLEASSTKDYLKTSMVTSITEFLQRYSNTMTGSAPHVALATRIDSESAASLGGKNGIVVAPLNDEFLLEVSDRIIIIRRDCHEVKIHLEISIDLLTELAYKTNDFLQYLLQYFVTLEESFEDMCEKYNALTSIQSVLQQKMQLLNERLGSFFASPVGSDEFNRQVELELQQSSQNGSALDKNTSPNVDLNLIPQMNKNPHQIFSQLRMLESKVNEIDSELLDYQTKQNHLMEQQKKMFGIGFSIEPSPRLASPSSLFDPSNNNSVQPLKQTFGDIITDIWSIYNTLISYRVRIQAANNELEH